MTTERDEAIERIAAGLDVPLQVVAPRPAVTLEPKTLHELGIWWNGMNKGEWIGEQHFFHLWRYRRYWSHRITRRIRGESR